MYASRSSQAWRSYDSHPRTNAQPCQRERTTRTGHCSGDTTRMRHYGHLHVTHLQACLAHGHGTLVPYHKLGPWFVPTIARACPAGWQRRYSNQWRQR